MKSKVNVPDNEEVQIVVYVQPELVPYDAKKASAELRRKNNLAKLIILKSCQRKELLNNLEKSLQLLSTVK